MNQISLVDAEYAGKRKKTGRDVFLEEIALAVQGNAPLQVIEPSRPIAGCGHRPYPLESILRVQLMEKRFALSDSEVE
jgi:IS5 family transposase